MELQEEVSGVKIFTPEIPVRSQTRLYVHEHPMLNPMLVQKILLYANPNFADLKNIRLVCQLWRDISLAKWRHTAVLTLHREIDIFASSPKKGLPASRYINVLVDPNDPINLQKFPFTRYKFRDMAIDMGQSEKQHPLLARFWSKVGRHMKYLHLENCDLIQSTPRPVEKLVLERTPKLEELVMSNCTSSDSNSQNPAGEPEDALKYHKKVKSVTLTGKKLPFRLPELLRCFKNLEVLKFQGFQDEPKLMDSLFETLYKFRLGSNRKHFNVKELELMVPHFTDNLHDQIILFRQLKLPLEVLRIQIPAKSDQSVFKSMLQPHLSKLRILDVFCPPINEKFSTVPLFDKAMPNLKELSLYGNVVSNLNFLENMPNLQVLKIDLHCLDKFKEVEWQMNRLNISDANFLSSDIVKETIFSQENVITNVEQFYLDFELDSCSLKKLAKWMPKLKKLETVATEANFPQIRYAWPKLEKLRCLVGSTVTDQVLINTAEQECFPDLKSFCLECFCGKGKLTDLSLKTSLVDLGRLENLSICVSNKVSVPVETLLRQKIQNVNILRSCTTHSAIVSKPHCLYCSYEKTATLHNINFRTNDENEQNPQ